MWLSMFLWLSTDTDLSVFESCITFVGPTTVWPYLRENTFIEKQHYDLVYILTQWGRCRGQPFSCWAPEPLVVKSGEEIKQIFLQLDEFPHPCRTIRSLVENNVLSFTRLDFELWKVKWRHLYLKVSAIMQRRNWTFKGFCYCENLWDVSSSFLHIVPIVSSTVDHQTSLLLNLCSWGEITNIQVEANY